MPLFESAPGRSEFTLHSGDLSDWRINCEALSDADLDTLARLYSRFYAYQTVVGVPTGGDRFAKALARYRTPRPPSNSHTTVLIADDVLTTGRSMREMRAKVLEAQQNVGVLGVVIFARQKTPGWVTAIWKLPGHMEGNT